MTVLRDNNSLCAEFFGNSLTDARADGFVVNRVNDERRSGVLIRGRVDQRISGIFLQIREPFFR